LDKEINNVKTTIKTLLKENKYTQKDLAVYLGISLPSVKRILGPGDLSLNRLSQISLFFNMTFSEFIELSNTKSLTYSMISPKQEKAFINDIINLKVFRSLVLGLNEDQIKKRYALSNSTYQKTLSTLERHELVEVWPSNRVRLQIKWPFQFLKSGAFYKKILPIFLNTAVKNSLQNSKLKALELAISKESILTFQVELNELLNKYKKISSSNMKACPLSELKEVTLIYSILENCVWDELI